MIANQGITHLLRPGRFKPEESYYYKLRSTYHGLILSATTITSGADVSDFLQTLGIKTPFLVDPRSYALAFDPKHLARDGGEEPSLTWKSVLAACGIRPECLPLTINAARQIAGDLAERTAQYELTCVPRERQLRFFAAEYDHEPVAVIPPYFAVAAVDDPWLDVSLQMAAETKRLVGGRPVWAVLLARRPLLSVPDQLITIARRYSSLSVDGFLIWISGFVEGSATPREVFGLCQLAKILGGQGSRPVVNMYGGYLSALLSHFGLSGFSHSFDAGESRSLVPVRGGPQEVRYYFPPLHKRYEVIAVEDYLGRRQIETPKEFQELVCNCTICLEVTRDGMDGFMLHFGARELKDGRVQGTSWAKGLASLHFLLNRYRELHQVEASNVDELVATLLRNAEAYRDPLILEKGSIDTAHLRRWAAGLAARDWPPD